MRRISHFCLNPLYFSAFTHCLEAPTSGQQWPYFNWIPKTGLSTLGKAEHPKAHHRMLKPNPALLLPNEAASSPAAEGPKAANTLGQVCSFAQTRALLQLLSLSSTAASSYELRLLPFFNCNY